MKTTGAANRNVSQFATTCWTVVLAAQKPDSPMAQEALATLCQFYWYPIYAYVRRQGKDADQAQDLTQEFFTGFLQRNDLRLVDRRKGRFRAFLLTACRNFLANQHDRAQAQKRGGGRPLVSIDAQEAENRYRLEPSHAITPERLFERRWALTLLENSLQRLRQEFRKANKEELFEQLKNALPGAPRMVSHAVLAERLKMTEGAVQVAVHRLRCRYRDVLREQIAATVEDASQVDDEIHDLFTSLGS